MQVLLVEQVSPVPQSALIRHWTSGSRSSHTSAHHEDTAPLQPLSPQDARATSARTRSPSGTVSGTNSHVRAHCARVCKRRCRFLYDAHPHWFPEQPCRFRLRGVAAATLECSDVAGSWPLGKRNGGRSAAGALGQSMFVRKSTRDAGPPLLSEECAASDTAGGPVASCLATLSRAGTRRAGGTARVHAGRVQAHAIAVVLASGTLTRTRLGIGDTCTCARASTRRARRSALTTHTVGRTAAWSFARGA